jgi:hypothetical protein
MGFFQCEVSCVGIVGGVCAQDISIIILHFELDSFYADVIELS